jgi:hypothetical protein
MTTLSQAPTQLYEGFDSFQGEARDTAVGGNTTDSSPTSLTGGYSTNYVSICTDSDSVSDSLSISASLSDASVDAKASWVQSLSITSTSVVVIVHTVVQTGQQQAASYSLTATAPPPVQDFFNAYGDSFVNEIVTGAEYYAAFIYDSTTVDKQDEIKTSLSGSAGTLSGKLSTTLDDVSSSTSTSMRVSQEMLGVSNIKYPDTDADSMVTFALGFPNETFNAPTILAYAVTGYEHVPGISGFQAVETNRNLLGTTTFVDASAALSSLSSQVALLQQMYSAYQYTSDTEFAGKAAQVDADLATLNALIAGIEANVTGQFTAPSLPSLDYGTPLVTYTVSPGITTTSSEFFYDLTATQIANGVTPASIVARSEGFQIAYSDGTVVEHNFSGNSVGSLNLENDSISLAAFPTASQYYEIGEMQTALGQSVGAAEPEQPGGTFVPWIYYKAPPPIIGFAGFCSKPPPYSIQVIPITITMYPTVWAQPITTDT